MNMMYIQNEFNLILFLFCFKKQNEKSTIWRAMMKIKLKYIFSILIGYNFIDSSISLSDVIEILTIDHLIKCIKYWKYTQEKIERY